jgi:hypothetical protein
MIMLLDDLPSVLDPYRCPLKKVREERGIQAPKP